MIPQNQLTRRTSRLLLRPIGPADRALVHRLQSDERSFVHAPWARYTTLQQSEESHSAWVQDWEVHGYGYWVAEDSDGKPVGLGGVRPIKSELDGSPALNLFYRLDSDLTGRGFGREIAREAAAFAVDWVPERPAHALIRPQNVASTRTAQSAGLTQIGTVDDVPGEQPSLLLATPDLLLADVDAARDEIVALWHEVNWTGGSVGFMGPAPAGEVEALYEGHAAEVRSGAAALLTLRDRADGALLGCGFWSWGSRQTGHVSMIKRLMIDPSREGRNLGRVLLAGLHAYGRSRGVEIAKIGVRGGTGLDAFYARSGYREIGRLPGGLRFGDDNRDDIAMAIRLDGQAL